jgi:hypothetical protein
LIIRDRRHVAVGTAGSGVGEAIAVGCRYRRVLLLPPNWDRSTADENQHGVIPALPTALMIRANMIAATMIRNSAPLLLSSFAVAYCMRHIRIYGVSSMFLDDLLA